MEHIGIEIRNLNNLISRKVSNLKTILLLDEITGNNGFILCYLAKNSSRVITQKDIEKSLGITRSTASTVLSLMEKKDLIKREILERDSRIKVINITSKGKELSSMIDKELEAFEKQLVSGFSKEEINSFLSYLYRIKENVGGGQK